MAETERYPDSDAGGPSGRQVATFIFGGLIAVALVLLIVQNSEERRVEWLFFEGDWPMWIVMVGSALAGAVLGWLVAFLVRRRRRR